MNKNHVGFWVGLAVFLLAAVYSVILFLLKPSFDLTAWVLYGATMVAFLLAGIQTIASSKGSSTIVMDTSLGIATSVYFVLQFIFGGIVCMCFTDVPLSPVIVCEIILLAAYLVITFLMYAAQSSNAGQDQHDRQAVQKKRLLVSEIRSMMEESTNPDVAKALSELAEAIHNSDVVLLPGLADVESSIVQNIAVLHDELSDEEADPLARIEKIHQLLKERDRTAEILKR